MVYHDERYRKISFELRHAGPQTRMLAMLGLVSTVLRKSRLSTRHAHETRGTLPARDEQCAIPGLLLRAAAMQCNSFEYRKHNQFTAATAARCAAASRRADTGFVNDANRDAWYASRVFQVPSSGGDKCNPMPSWLVTEPASLRCRSTRIALAARTQGGRRVAWHGQGVSM